MESPTQCVELDRIESVSVVRFTDQKVMDPSRIEAMGLELLELVDRDDTEQVLINFENVSFFSSAAINKLIVVDRRVKARGGQLCLTNLRPEVQDLFSYTNLDQVFRIHENQTDGIEALGSEG